MLTMEDRATIPGFVCPVLPRASVTNIPIPVSRYLAWSGTALHGTITSLRQRQEGRFRMNLEGAWYPLVGELRLRPEQLTRVWTASLKPFPFVHLTGRDSYVEGAGRMLIRAYDRFKLADSTGPEMDRSALVTILAELPLAPSAMKPSQWLSWEAVDDLSAYASLSDHGRTVSGLFTFSPAGEPLRFESEDRYRQVGKTAVRTPWLVKYLHSARVDGWRIPVEFEAAWRLDDVVLSYARFQATYTCFEIDA